MRTSRLTLAVLACASLLGACQSVDTSYYSSRHDMLGKPVNKYATGTTNTVAQTTTNAPAKPSP